MNENKLLINKNITLVKGCPVHVKHMFQSWNDLQQLIKNNRNSNFMGNFKSRPFYSLYTNTFTSNNKNFRLYDLQKKHCLDFLQLFQKFIGKFFSKQQIEYEKQHYQIFQLNNYLWEWFISEAYKYIEEWDIVQYESLTRYIQIKLNAEVQKNMLLSISHIKFTNLITLQINNCKLGSIQSLEWLNSINLNRISFYDCNLTNLQPFAKIKLNKIKQINLKQNKFDNNSQSIQLSKMNIGLQGLSQFSLNNQQFSVHFPFSSLRDRITVMRNRNIVKWENVNSKNILNIYLIKLKDKTFNGMRIRSI